MAECVGLDEQLGVMASAVDAGDALFIDDGELAKVRCTACVLPVLPCVPPPRCLPAARAAAAARVRAVQSAAPLQRLAACLHPPVHPLPAVALARRQLATDVPDLRVRLGLGDTEVFGGQGFSLAALQMKVRAGRRGVPADLLPTLGVLAERSVRPAPLNATPAPEQSHCRPSPFTCHPSPCTLHPSPQTEQIKEGAVKIVDGVLFGVRGVKLLLADVGSAGKLFWRAVRGESAGLGWAGLLAGSWGSLAGVLRCPAAGLRPVWHALR